MVKMLTSQAYDFRVILNPHSMHSVGVLSTVGVMMDTVGKSLAMLV
jgi:hypothetical protein